MWLVGWRRGVRLQPVHGVRRMTTRESQVALPPEGRRILEIRRTMNNPTDNDQANSKLTPDFVLPEWGD